MLKEYITKAISEYLSSVNESFYAVCILVTCNEACRYKDIDNFMSVSINCNSQVIVDDSADFEEAKWNIAFWGDSNEHFLIDPDENAEGAELLYEWYRQNNIKNVGYEDEQKMYDADMNYIGSGPVGYRELCTLVAEIIGELRGTEPTSNILKNIPVIITDYDYSRFIIDFVNIANPNNEAEEFLSYYNCLG